MQMYLSNMLKWKKSIYLMWTRWKTQSFVLIGISTSRNWDSAKSAIQQADVLITCTVNLTFHLSGLKKAALFQTYGYWTWSLLKSRQSDCRWQSNREKKVINVLVEDGLLKNYMLNLATSLLVIKTVGRWNHFAQPNGYGYWWHCKWFFNAAQEQNVGTVLPLNRNN